MIHLEWYRIFKHTARHGNLTKAAQELHITQPSVSYALKQLESSLGIALFQRMSKGVKLTEEGRALLEYVEQSFSLLEAAQKHMEEMKRLTEGELRIGASDSLIKHLLLPKLNEFHKRHPGIRIRLSHGRTPEITQRLKDGLIDCALVHLPVNDPQLDIRKLAALEDCFVVGSAPAYAQLIGRELSVQELAELPLLLLSQGSSTRTFVEQWFAARGHTIKADIELGSVDLLTEFAKLGYGAALITRSFIREELELGELIELRLAEALPPREIGFAVRRQARLSLAAERFAGMLGE